jgi:hypothetical protein
MLKEKVIKVIVDLTMSPVDSTSDLCPIYVVPFLQRQASLDNETVVIQK